MIRNTAFLLTMFAGLLTGVPAAAQQDADLPRLQELAKILEKDAADFSDQFDKELDKSILDETKIKGKLDKRAEKLRGSIDDVRDKLKSGKIDKAREKLDRSLQLAHDLHLVMKQRRFSEELEQLWIGMVANLNVLADYYGMRPLT